MNAIINGQVQFVLVTLCLGMLLMAGYDVIRFLRWIVPHHRAVIAAEDIFYWLMAVIPVYMIFYRYNYGEIRWYGALAVFLGGIIYEKGISCVIRGIGKKYLEKPKRKLLSLLRKLSGCLRLRKLYKKEDERLCKMSLKKGKK